MSEGNSSSVIYLIPVSLYEGELKTIPSYLLDAIKDCQVFFVENERSARRFLKSLWREMVIDNYGWINMTQDEAQVRSSLRQAIRDNKNIGVISEAGCPGIADPGQMIAEEAHKAGATVKPLVGPSSILLALMASGLNGQCFQFNGYLPIDATERSKTIKQLESESMKKKCTQLFIETPYRNNQMLESILKSVQPATRICVAADLTSPKEFIKTKTAAEWKKQIPDLHKRPTIFLLLA